MTAQPAGMPRCGALAGIEQPGTGRHHLLINVSHDEIDFDESIPADVRFHHFGGGQTEVALDLPPGIHSLTIVLDDRFHAADEPLMLTDPITITVEQTGK